MAPEVFISYAHLDDKVWTEKFHELLQQELNQRVGRAVSVWRDPRLPVGADWHKDMLAAARTAKAFVPLVSPGWLASTACLQELEAAAGSNLFCVRLLDAELPDKLKGRLYQEMFELGKDQVPHNFKPSSAPFGKSVARVAHGIAELLRTPASDIDAQVSAIRLRVAPEIRRLCGTMRILDMQQAIDSASIYTAVKIQAKPSRLRAAQEILGEDGQDVDRFGLQGITERLDAMEAVGRHPRLMILGKPGAGKTTFLKRLGYLCAMGEFRPDLAPAFLELRGLKGRTLQQWLTEQWGDAPESILQAGRALLLLDGLDEVPAGEFNRLKRELDRLAKAGTGNRLLDEVPAGEFSILKRELDRLAEPATGNLLFVTSRIAAREYQLPGGKEVEVADFDREQMEEFARHWFTARERPELEEPFLRTVTGNTQIRELAQSPLLLTLMCLLHEEGFDLQGGRAELYGEATDLLLRK
jgi:hypothetical protein